MNKRIVTICLVLLLSGMTGGIQADVVVVVSSQNPIESLSRNELADMYLGRLDRFPGIESSVSPVDQKEGSPVHDEFYSRYLGRTPAQIKAHWSKLIFTGRGQPPRSVADSGAVVELVAGDPGAIGYIDPSHLDERLRVVSID